MGKVVVTGANGFIGGILCNALVQEGIEAIGVIRKNARVPFNGTDITWLRRDEQAWNVLNGLSGIDTVVHLSGVTSGVDEALLHHINVTETQKLFDKACQLGAKRFVFLSTVKVHGEMSTTPFTEKSPFNPMTPYARSKFMAEQVLLEANQNQGIDLVILRPPAVYGPGMKGNLLKVLWLLKRNLPVIAPEEGGLRSLVYVHNLVDAILHIIRLQPPLRSAFFVSDGHDLDFMELVSNLISCMQSRSRIIRLPAVFWRMGGHAPFLNEYVLRATACLQVSSEKIQQELHWRPVFGIQDALKQTAQWFLQKE